jgi:hypothetical protein
LQNSGLGKGPGTRRGRLVEARHRYRAHEPGSDQAEVAPEMDAGQDEQGQTQGDGREQHQAIQD